MKTTNTFKKVSPFRITKYFRWIQSIKNVNTRVDEKSTKQKAKEKNERKNGKIYLTKIMEWWNWHQKNMRKSKYTKIVWYDTVTWWYHLTNCNEKKIDEEV